MAVLDKCERHCLPLFADSVKEETEKNKILSKVFLKTHLGWPNSLKALSKKLHPYFDGKLQLTVHNGCILYGYRVVTPLTLQQ